jgi:hypothetical protein
MGEIFDRALTLYVRNFVVFTLIMLTLELPLQLALYLLVPHSHDSLQQVLQQMQYPGERPYYSASQIWSIVAVAFFGALLATFVQTAIAAAVATADVGEVPDYAGSFARVFRRASALLGTVALEVLVGIFAYIAIAIVLVIAVGTFMVVAPGAQQHVPTGLIAFILFFVLLLAALAVPFTTACYFGLNAAVLEDCAPFPALWSGFGRIFNRRRWRLVALFSLAYIALCLAVTMMGAVLGAIANIANLSVLTAVVDSIVGAVVGGFSTTLIAVFYFQVRKSEEGVTESVVATATEEPEPVYADTAYATGEERAMIYRFLERRSFMPPERRAAMAAELAARVRPRVPPELQTLPDEALLERL